MVRFHPPPPEACTVPKKRRTEKKPRAGSASSKADRLSGRLSGEETFRDHATWAPDEPFRLLGCETKFAVWRAFQPVLDRTLPAEPVVLQLVGASDTGFGIVVTSKI